jgi:hypothetical protein
MWTLLAALLTHAHAGWTIHSEADGCTFYVGAQEGDVAPVRAVCDWAIAPDRLHRALADMGRHDDYFSSVESSTVTGPGIAEQVHVASGISKRAVRIRYGQEAIAGGVRYAWDKAPDQSGMDAYGVIPSADRGSWEVTALPDGTSHVVYELRYGAGGSVPSFLVRWFQGSGTKALVLELKAWVLAH